MLQSFGRLMIAAIACAILLYAGSFPAIAHGAGWQIDQNRTATIYQFGYTDGKPMIFAEAMVTSPDGKTWQKGRTDRDGRLAVAVPSLRPEDDTDAHWKIMVSDGMGHQVVLIHSPEKTPPPGTQSSAPTPGLQGNSALLDLPVWAAILFGFSLIANLAFLPSWITRIKRQRKSHLMQE
ncbi:hypothetical protein ACFOY8_08700 [Thalassospira xianhensis]|uniref:hypothetical protein n=1 Tax=Thalassospira xianhensis TaxID=478503 RepID=UPI000DEDE685|nr:hypothetical protein [Thalassospira xianhensis]